MTSSSNTTPGVSDAEDSSTNHSRTQHRSINYVSQKKSEARLKEFKRFILTWWDNKPTLKNDHGNSSAVKDARDNELYPTLLANFPDVCKTDSDWKKTAAEVMNSKKSNWRRRRKRRSSSSHEEHEQYKRQRSALGVEQQLSTPVPGATVNQSRSPLGEESAVNRPGFPFEQTIVVLKFNSLGQQISCISKELSVQKTGREIAHLEPTDLRMAHMDRWAREGLRLGENEKLIFQNTDGEMVMDEKSFQAFSAEQYWKGARRLRFNVEVAKD
jgi:hypothetical protein